MVKGTGDSFDIFLQSDSEIFVKFTSADPKHQGKVLSLLEEGEIDQTFYIREEDLYKYYQYATKSLYYEQSRCTSRNQNKKVYEVS